MSGAVEAVSEPSGARKAEPPGTETKIRIAIPSDERGQPGVKPAPLFRAERFHLRHLRFVAIHRGRRLQARLDHAIGQEPAQPHDQERGSAGEKPVTKRIDQPGRVDDLGRGLREPGEQRVEARGNKIRAETAGDAGKRGRDPGQRMSPRRIKDHAPERDHQHVAGIGRGMAHDRDQDQHRG